MSPMVSERLMVSGLKTGLRVCWADSVVGFSLCLASAHGLFKSLVLAPSHLHP